MDDDYTETVRILRRPKVTTDAVGGTVWTETVEDVELEIVSTAMLEALILEDEDTMRMQLRNLESSQDGVLARDHKKQAFEVIPRKDFDSALSQSTKPDKPKSQPSHQSRYITSQVSRHFDEESLVSTQVIRKMNDRPRLSPQQAINELRLVDEPDDTGFDPYNKV
ncbi:MAG: hypothetical protein AAGA84_04495 [Pseudomonadota bacterium]